MPVGGSFAVVTPNLNTGRYLAETIESVLESLRPGDAYVVVDGGSADESLEVIRRYEKFLTWWVSEPDRGYADAVAKGFARAQGELQCWVNSGDLLLNGALARVRNCFDETGADFVFGDDFTIDGNGAVVAFSRGYVRSLRASMLFGGWTPLQDACFWRRNLYERVGGIDATLEHAADYDLFLRFSLVGKCAYAPVAFSAFRRHLGQQSIAAARDYAREREQSRARALTAVPRARRVFLGAYYWVVVRYRARVLHRRWNLPHLIGRQARSLSSRSYGPASHADERALRSVT